MEAVLDYQSIFGLILGFSVVIGIMNFFMSF